LGFLPFRINPVEIKIRHFDTVATVIDEDFREELSGKVFESETTIKGQVNFRGKDLRNLTPTMGGDAEATSGYFVFKKSDLDDAGVALKKGDRITEIANEPMDIELTQIRFESPLRDPNGIGEFLLVYAEFEELREERRSL